MITRNRYNTAQRAACDAPASIQSTPEACEMTASEIRTRAASSTVSCGGDNQPEVPQINTAAIETFLQAAQSTPFSSARSLSKSDSDHSVEFRTAAHCWTPRVISGAESGEPESSSSPGIRLGDEPAARALNRSLRAAGNSTPRIPTVKEPT